MDPLQQVPDEESLLELSTAPETQVEHLEGEGEVISSTSLMLPLHDKLAVTFSMHLTKPLGP